MCKTGISALKSSWFSKKTIEVLNTSENKIKALKKDDMKNFLKMRIFNASFNEIKTVEANTFLEPKKLEVISLSHNQIVNVAFANLESLKQLHLRGNAIETVSSKFSDEIEKFEFSIKNKMKKAFLDFLLSILAVYHQIFLLKFSIKINCNKKIRKNHKTSRECGGMEVFFWINVMVSMFFEISKKLFVTSSEE